jgi:hypothetical protein
MGDLEVQARLVEIPLGYSEVLFYGQRWSVTKTTSVAGRSIKLFARELGGTDFVSCNFYQTRTGQIMKPCEMPLEKVREFLLGSREGA